jgi:hypothetical protein
MRTATLATFHTAPPAVQLKNWLSRAGVPSRVRHVTLQHWWSWQKPLPAFLLEVPHDHADHANALLFDWENSAHALDEAIRCPLCSALRIEYPHVPGKRVMPATFARLLMSLGIMRHHFSCEECGYSWRGSEFAANLQPANQSH